MTIRKPVVAGQFYPSSRNELERTIKSLSVDSVTKTVKGAVLPHAGYVYSGSVAAKTASACEFNNHIIMIGPNHTGEGPELSVMLEGLWRTPLGDIEIDRKLADKIIERSEYLEEDTLAHSGEHSLEVVLPFLQYRKKTIKIVPIVVSYVNIEICKQAAKDIVSSIDELSVSNDVSIVASSDMTHYMPHDTAKKNDKYAIEAILKLDAEGLLKRVNERNISMCGAVPVAIMLEATRALGAQKAELIDYKTSGDASGDYGSVVGYAGIRIT